MTENPEERRTDKPMRGPKRPTWLPLAVTVGLLALIFAVFLLYGFLETRG